MTQICACYLLLILLKIASIFTSILRHSKSLTTSTIQTRISDAETYGSNTCCNGVFGALQLVRDYEVDNFGLVATDLKNTYEVENMMNIVRDFHEYDRMFDHHTSDVEAYEKYLEHLRKDYEDKHNNHEN